MKLRLNTYTAYSIGCVVVWAVILAVVAAEASKDTKHTFIDLLWMGDRVVVGHHRQGRLSAAHVAAGSKQSALKVAHAG